MLFTKEDKILIKNLFELKGYNARHLESFPEKAKMSAVSTSCCNSICHPHSNFAVIFGVRN